MKKVLALVICIAMIACVAVTASAAEKPLTITVSSAEAKVGDTVAITVSLSEKSLVGSLQMFVSVDEALEPVTQKDDRGSDVYFVAGPAATDASALVECSNGLINIDPEDPDSEKVIKLATSSSKGYWLADPVWTLFFKVVSELPEDGALIDVLDDTVDAKVADGEDTYAITVVDGKVSVPAEPVPPVSSEDDKPSETEPTPPSKPQSTTDTNPATGDATGIAVAAGLCAVMAAAFVITKKVND